MRSRKGVKESSFKDVGKDNRGVENFRLGTVMRRHKVAQETSNSFLLRCFSAEVRIQKSFKFQVYCRMPLEMSHLVFKGVKSIIHKKNTVNDSTQDIPT